LDKIQIIEQENKDNCCFTAKHAKHWCLKL